MKKKRSKIILPALRGIMGDWLYYSSLMDLGELSARVRFADEVHKNKALSDMIQRQLQRGRSSQIAEYLKTQSERFFNSLVIATYGGQPNWHALSDIRSKKKRTDLNSLSDETIASVGFLTLQGNEKLFALDGQHRLAGIKKAVKDGVDDDPYDEVSVIFVAHKETKKGLERTRRLFTTLNQKAKSVSKGDIIALHEDDVMAISARWLIEETNLFSKDRIAFVASNNMPVGNTISLTTMANLYDVLQILFSKANTELKKSKAELIKARPNDDELNEYFSSAKHFFNLLRRNFGEIGEFFEAENTKPVVKKYRGSHGGSALFRPIGLDLFTLVISRLSNDMPIDKAVKLAAKLPRKLDAAPYDGLMWDSSNETILNSHRVTLREILLYMLNRKSNYSDKTLLERYRRETGDESRLLPEKVN